MFFSYALHVWKELDNHNGLRESWRGDSNSKGMNRWCNDLTNKKFKALTFLTAWGIWFARNA